MFIPERQREALMRLTMCARDECMMCIYQPKDDRCKDIATTAMHILANALEVDDDDTPHSCFNCDHYEPKGWCNLFEDTVSPNYKCCSEFAEIKPCEYEIKALHKEYREPYCEVADTPQTERKNDD